MDFRSAKVKQTETRDEISAEEENVDERGFKRPKALSMSSLAFCRQEEGVMEEAEKALFVLRQLSVCAIQ